MTGAGFFSRIYTLWLSLLHNLSDVWRVLDTPISRLPIPNLPDFGDGILSSALGSILNAIYGVVSDLLYFLFGETTLIELVLCVGIAVIVGCYIIKFVLMLIPGA